MCSHCPDILEVICFFFSRKFSLVPSKRWLYVYQLYFLGISGRCKFLLKTTMEVPLRHYCVRFFVRTFHFHIDMKFWSKLPIAKQQSPSTLQSWYEFVIFSACFGTHWNFPDPYIKERPRSLPYIPHCRGRVQEHKFEWHPFLIKHRDTVVGTLPVSGHYMQTSLLP